MHVESTWNLMIHGICKALKLMAVRKGHLVYLNVKIVQSKFIYLPLAYNKLCFYKSTWLAIEQENRTNLNLFIDLGAFSNTACLC